MENIKNIRNMMNIILNFMAALSLAAMVVLTCYQVFTRYILKSPSSWSEELVAYLFGWMALLGASVMTGERGHMNIPVLADRMGRTAGRLLLVFSEVIALLFSAIILIYGGIKITSLAMGQLTSSLGVAVGVFYIIMPVCGIINVVYTLLNIIDIIKGREI